ncbi:MAG TPA: c-type cytochrome [Bryobacteraceae bacterium]|nr:c-type cytochrome [Bryobacteraceae bacterium]
MKFAFCLLLTLCAYAGDGKDLFERRCAGCHALDKDKEGPRLRGVYGRASGSVPSFLYSDGLKKAGILWDDQSLERWLTNPEAVVSDTDMGFHVKDAEERKAIIEYLKSLGPQPASIRPLTPDAWLGTSRPAGQAKRLP